MIEHAPRISLRGFSFAAIGWITAPACFLRFPCSRSSPDHDRQTPPPARDLRRRRRRRASRRGAGGASAAPAEGPRDLPCRRQGRGRHGGGGGAALSRQARPRPLAAFGGRDHAPRPRRADAADQGDRGRPSRARRGRIEGRGGEPATRRRCRCRRSVAGAFVRRRLRQLDRAGCGRILCAEAAGDARAVALGRADRRGQHRPQAFVADQGRPAGARREAGRNRDAGDLRRAARRPFRDRLGADGAGSDHAGGRPRAGRQIWPSGRRRRPPRARRPRQ